MDETKRGGERGAEAEKLAALKEELLEKIEAVGKEGLIIGSLEQQLQIPDTPEGRELLGQALSDLEKEKIIELPGGGIVRMKE